MMIVVVQTVNLKTENQLNVSHANLNALSALITHRIV
jgi:hypothetical protein